MMGALFALFWGLLAEANIFVADRRVDVSAVPRELQPIGILKSKTVSKSNAMRVSGSTGSGAVDSWGTAFLVGECHILTAYHVAFPDLIASKDKTSTFFVGRADGASRSNFLSSALAHPIAWGDFHTRNFKGLTGDWALLQLSDCLGRYYGWINWDTPIYPMTERTRFVSLASYPQDRRLSSGISIEKSCSIQVAGFAFGLVGVDCAMIEGSSGGPLLEVSPDGTLSLTGIAIRRLRPVNRVLPEFDVQHANLAVLKEAFQGALETHVRPTMRK